MVEDAAPGDQLFQRSPKPDEPVDPLHGCEAACTHRSTCDTSYCTLKVEIRCRHYCTAKMLLAVALAVAAAAQRDSCTAKAVYPDGSEEERECTLMSERQMAPGTKARFESCTQ